ncbi:hypothetical protein ACFXGI_02805 [Streptomyces sp. NPDC059355]|uniref:hypothetical protein n=1 Tax=Streptomyces sp. NPDC059355 TaxID=3346811 RepID=UPI00367CB3D1
MPGLKCLFRRESRLLADLVQDVQSPVVDLVDHETGPLRSPRAWPVPGRRKGWCAGPTEPGNVFVMFFQRPIYE